MQEKIVSAICQQSENIKNSLTKSYEESKWTEGSLNPERLIYNNYYKQKLKNRVYHFIKLVSHLLR